MRLYIFYYLCENLIRIVMKTKILALLLLLPFLSMAQEFRLINSTDSNIVIDILTPEFQTQTVTTPKGEAMILTAPKAMNRAETGTPDLPMLVIPTIIGDDALMQVKVTEANYVEYNNMEIAPSKGDFPRSIDPNDVPYTYSEVYQQNAFFPSQIARLDEPYIHRDVRGQNIIINPYVYNPVTKVLRVYTHLSVEMVKVGTDDRNIITHRAKTLTLDPEFKAIYENRYINYKETFNRYTPIEDNGALLIICHDAFMTAMEPFVAWKKQIGRPTTMVGTSTTGTTADAIRTYIANYYAANPTLTDILLVGDVAQIPGVHVEAGTGYYGYSGYGDMPYGQTAGNDYYNELIVGRFCCETEAQVTNHVNKVLNYDRDLNETDTWLSVGQGVSTTSQGGHYNEADYQHIDNIRNDLLGYNYTNVYRDYKNVDGTTATSASDVSQHINEGVSIINYCNHGSITNWTVFSYSNSHVNALVNDYKLPYIISVACLNGKYDESGNCFGETWMRATNNTTGNPTGAIGGMFSYISQPWTPPQYGQDEMVDILVESYANNIRRTMGGVSVNGDMKVLDQGASQNPVKGTYNTWILYGDPTLTLRNATQTDMGISHNTIININATSFGVNANDGDGALATLTKDGEIMGSASIENGSALIEFSAPGELGEATLTVFGYNKITYIATVNIVSEGTVTPNPPTGVTATVNGQQITLSWTAADPADSYKVYRNGTMIAQGLTTTTYTDSGLSAGTYNYQVSTVYQGIESMRSAITTATLYESLAVTVTASDPIYVPNPVPGGWTGITLSADATGGDGNYSYSWTPANAVDNPTSQSTTASPVTTTTYTCTVTSTGQAVSASVTVIVVNPPTEFHAEIVNTDEVLLSWAEAEYADSYNLYRNDELIASELTGLTYTDHFHGIGSVHYSIESVFSGHVSQPEITGVFFCAAPENVTAEYVWDDGRFYTRINWTKNIAVDYSVNVFKVYRDDATSYRLIAEIENEDYVYEYQYDDTTASIGIHQYYVSATYRYYDCEEASEPVQCEVTQIEERQPAVKVYPNPAEGALVVEAPGMSQIRLINVMGQVVYHHDIEGEHARIDLSSMAKGVCTLLIQTEEGQTTERIVIK